MSDRRTPLAKIALVFAAVHLLLAVVAALDANWIRAGLQVSVTLVWGGWYYWFNVRSGPRPPRGSRVQ